MSYVYRLTFPNGAVYIGKTDRDPEERWMNGWGYRNIPQVFHAILQYGWNNVRKEIVAENVSETTAARMELDLIRKYSITFYGEVLAQQYLHSDASKGESAQHFSQEHSCTVLLNGTGVAPEFVEASSDRFFDLHSKDIEEKRTEAKKRPSHKRHIIPIVEKPLGMTTCPVSVYTKDGTYIATYPSVKVTSEAIGVYEGDIVSCCKGKRSDGVARYQCKGYIFRYAPYTT